MLIKPLSPAATHPALAFEAPALSRGTAAMLHAASRALHRLATQLAAAPAHGPVATAPVMLEFHAEAGAPEGALYVDGQLVARLVGVNRL